MTQILLTELLCAKFCHDLAGPVGAINNGLEFLEESNEEMQVKALDLIKESAFEASARLQFFRQTYGVVSSEGEADISRLRKLAENFFQKGKISLDWPNHHTEAAGIPLSHKLGRLTLNLLLVTAAALIHGGVVSVRLEKSLRGRVLTVRGAGREVKTDPEIQTILSGNNNQVVMDKRNVQVHLTRVLAQELGMPITFDSGEEYVEISAHWASQEKENREHDITVAGT